MVALSDTSTLFGLSRVLEPESRSAIAEFLRAAWAAQFGQRPGPIEGDLELLGRLFRPDVSGASLRGAAATLEALTISPPRDLPAALYVPVDDTHGFVTPEGRVALEVIDHAGEDPVSIGDSALLRATTIVATFYGESVRRHVGKTVGQPDLRPLSFAFALLLLVNGSVGEERALRTPDTADEERRLMEAIAPALDAFSEGIGGGPISRRESGRMEGNWVLTEVPRQLPTLIAKTKAGFWVQPHAYADAARRIGALLARRRRPPTGTQDCGSRSRTSAGRTEAHAQPSPH